MNLKRRVDALERRGRAGARPPATPAGPGRPDFARLDRAVKMLAEGHLVGGEVPDWLEGEEQLLFAQYGEVFAKYFYRGYIADLPEDKRPVAYRELPGIVEAVAGMPDEILAGGRSGPDEEGGAS
jgi:hypothetical protein